ncbi:DMT family transporter [Deferribacter autotrophicus]|uniref:DMT family transporter n=1 Tax=Deferribacter autotrophicus TaxID=500465 RepID=A0A5A8F663_9BACT|nr:DMT family transporter [Deferribacter autotrophicus]KAA0258640.1 DMT family transporter [Deferribacter autotrophicus]
MSKYLVMFLLFIAGTFVSLQASLNARLAKYTGFLESTFISFFVGTLTLLLFLFFKGFGNLKNISEVPILYLSGGVLGAFFVFVITYSVPRIGVSAALSITIAVQLILGLIIDKYNPFDVSAFHVSFFNILGVILIFLGVIFLTYNR